MKYFQVFPLLLVSALSLNATGCQVQPEMARCVDYQNHVVAPSLCSARSQSVKVQGSLYPEPMYHTYYGGFGSYEVGSTAWGGSDQPIKSHVYQSADPQETQSALAAGSQPYVVAPR